MNIYAVTVETTVMVLATDPATARKVGIEGAVEELEEGRGRALAFPIESIGEVAEEWRHSLPYVAQKSDNPDELMVVQLLEGS